MRLPVRIRLTAWYVALLAVVVAALGAFVVGRLETDLTADIDRSLSADAKHIARGYAAEGAKDFHDVSATVLPGGRSGAQVLDRAGRVVVSHGSAVAQRPMIDAATLPADPSRATRRLGLPGEDYRTLAVPVRRRGQPQTLVVAQSLAGVHEAKDRVRTLILIAGPAALLLTAAGGWWLARKALRPVGRMAAQAERIEIDRLEERIPVPPARDELARLAATLNAMLDRLARGVEERRRLIADASHELRSPLAAMRAEIDVALDGDELPPAAREVLDSAREEVDRLAAIVADLLTLARIDEGRLGLEAGPAELRDVAHTVARDLHPLAAAKRVRLTVAGDAALAAADPRHVRHALANLVDNAIEASPPDAEVTIASWRRDGRAGLTVTDAGPGVPERDRDRIFERFARLDEARTRRDRGSGLGLAICRELIEAHGGGVSVTSTGRGSSFSIALPAAAAAPALSRR